MVRTAQPSGLGRGPGVSALGFRSQGLEFKDQGFKVKCSASNVGIS